MAGIGFNVKDENKEQGVMIKNVEKEYNQLIEFILGEKEGIAKELNILEEIKSGLVILGKQIKALEEQVGERHLLNSRIGPGPQYISKTNAFRIIAQIEELDDKIYKEKERILNELEKYFTKEVHEFYKAQRLGEKETKHINRLVRTMQSHLAGFTFYLNTAKENLEQTRYHFQLTGKHDDSRTLMGFKQS